MTFDPAEKSGVKGHTLTGSEYEERNFYSHNNRQPTCGVLHTWWQRWDRTLQQLQQEPLHTSMTTQSGHSYKVMEDTPQQQRAASESSPTHHDTAHHDLPDLAQMMQALLEDHRLREAENAEDRWQREVENEERMRGMHEQIEMLQQLVTDRHTTTTRRSSSDCEGMRLSRLSEQDDIEAYLLTFERMMQAYAVDRPRWTYKLAPQLTGKTQQAYTALRQAITTR